LTVRLSSDETQLRLLVSNPGGGYSSIAQRSDGLRAFVALVAYTARYGEADKPILLIDEAEAHLHYDAQADLVGVFYRQEAASQIIYTTHSAGCLPQDLGTGVRVVAPREGHDRSDIRNAFWVEGPGFSPLLLAMGATTLAFTPSRYAVLAEGPSETIMLPTLLREATGLTDLGYQVAPGLASVPEGAVSLLDLEGARVAYVVDGDEAGKTVRRKLVTAGVDENRIVTLGRPKRVGIVLEDLLEPRTYVDAINEEIRRSNGEGLAMPETAITRTKRLAAVTQWCNSKGIGVPRKTAVAARVVEKRRDAKLVSDDGRIVLQQLHQDLVQTLGL
jgi:predicted ATP-dependent endonuclease of OLD family